MAANRVTSTARYVASSRDPRPTSVSTGALLFEWDTRRTYEYGGAGWNLKESEAAADDTVAGLLQAMLVVQHQTLEVLQALALKVNE
jgi:hypothetical protein